MTYVVNLETNYFLHLLFLLGSTEMADKAAAVAKIKAYFDFKHPENWLETGVIEYNQGFDTFRGLIKVTHKDFERNC
jgi:hypothetical protein